MTAQEKRLSYLFAFIMGLSMTGFMLHQALLPAIKTALSLGDEQVAWMSGWVSGGFFLGMLFIAPLGDLFNRKTLLVIKMILLTCALFLTGSSKTLSVLLGGGLLIGVFATLTSDVIALASGVVSSQAKAAALSIIMTGGVLGGFLSRVFAGFVATWFNWQTCYFSLAVVFGLLALLASRLIPREANPASPPTLRSIYSSMFALTLKHPTLRTSILGQGFYGVAFMAFWSTMSLCLAAAPYSWSLSSIGLMGLCATLGIVMVPVFGKRIDRIGPIGILFLAEILALGSFLAGYLAPGSTAVVIGATIFFDAGFQLSQFAQVFLISGIDPMSRARILAVYNTVYYAFRTAGALIGAYAWAHEGWRGVNLTCLIAIVLSTAVLLLSKRRKSHDEPADSSGGGSLMNRSA